MVAVPVAPTPLLRVKADAASAVMAPTAGVLAKAATVSLFVLISTPLVKAAFAARVRPVHDTVTAPATSVAVVSKLIVTTPEANADVDFVTGEVMLHLSAAFAVTRSLGNDIMI